MQKTKPSKARKKTRKKQDASTRLIYDRLLQQFPLLPTQIEQVVYRYNAASVRVRVIDPIFAGKNDQERELLVGDFLKSLPEDVEGDIMLLLLLTPSEAKDPREIMNRELEKPDSTM